MLCAGGVDILEAVKIKDLPLGVKETVGICPNRPGDTAFIPADLDEETVLASYNESSRFEDSEDIAYKLDPRAILSVNTGTVYPDGFPTDFSLITTFRQPEDTNSVLFAIYNGAGDEQLALEISDNITLVYQVNFHFKFLIAVICLRWVENH